MKQACKNLKHLVNAGSGIIKKTASSLMHLSYNMIPAI